MMNISLGRFVWTFLVGYLVTSNLNWAVAELLLNPWAIPAFDGFMRTVDSGGADPWNIVKMSVGFMGPLFVVAVMLAMIDKPGGWAARAVFVAVLVSLGAFYGTYTFISGWGHVGWWPLMVTATCDLATLVVGALLISYLQHRGRKNP